jgi:hypothetical protein
MIVTLVKATKITVLFVKNSLSKFFMFFSSVSEFEKLTEIN